MGVLHAKNALIVPIGKNVDLASVARESHIASVAAMESVAAHESVCMVEEVMIQP